MIKREPKGEKFRKVSKLNLTYDTETALTLKVVKDIVSEYSTSSKDSFSTLFFPVLWNMQYWFKKYILCKVGVLSPTPSQISIP